MSARKPATTKSTAKKAAVAKAAPSHPTWADMIKECIAVNTEDARIGVSRPQIKKYVETKYKLEIGAAQSTQLAKAISTGADKGVFVLPKGPSGRVKLAPKSKPADTSSKENKPAPKPVSKSKAATTKAKTAKAAPASKSAAKTATAKKAVSPAKSKAPAAKKVAPKKVLAGKSKAKAAPAKKTTTASKRAPGKKAATGTSAASKAKAATKKAPTKKAAPKKEVAKKEVAKPATRVPRKSPTKRS